MDKLILGGALLAGALTLSQAAFAHGGTYRGPGDTVPPAGGGGGGPTAGPTSGGPSGSSTPGTTPGTGGPAIPGIPGGAPTGQAGPSTGGGDASGGDLEVWQFWWGFNKDPYLKLKAAIHEGGPLTGSDEFYIGRERHDAQDRLRPSEEKIRGAIVPALLAALESEDNNDIVTGCLVALAKIGDAADEHGASRFEGVIAEFLKHANQEIAETAAVSLGILASEASIDTLTALVTEDPERARELVGRAEVDYRTRASRPTAWA